MSKKDKKKDNLSAEERAIVDGIDYEKIATDAAADVAARKDEIIA
ncbi:hypothetical protein LCGC14_1304110, partial [marine sediment metagenome]